MVNPHISSVIGIHTPRNIKRSLIGDYLPLIRVKDFNDKTEGAILRAVLGKLLNTSGEIIEIAIQAYLSSVSISSWHYSVDENASMWERYGGKEGVAIQTNAKLLIDCINAGDPSFLEKTYPPGRFVTDPPGIPLPKPHGEIRNVEYTSLKPSNFQIQANDMINGYEKKCFFYKMKDFRDEKEVRILNLSPPNLYDLLKKHTEAVRENKKSNVENIIGQTIDYSHNSKIWIDSAEKLIQKVVVSPNTHDDFIKTVDRTIAHIFAAKRLIKAGRWSINIGFPIVHSVRKEWL